MPGILTLLRLGVPAKPILTYLLGCSVRCRSAAPPSCRRSSAGRRPGPGRRGRRHREAGRDAGQHRQAGGVRNPPRLPSGTRFLRPEGEVRLVGQYHHRPEGPARLQRPGAQGPLPHHPRQGRDRRAGEGREARHQHHRRPGPALRVRQPVHLGQRRAGQRGLPGQVRHRDRHVRQGRKAQGDPGRRRARPARPAPDPGRQVAALGRGNFTQPPENFQHSRLPKNWGEDLLLPRNGTATGSRGACWRPAGGSRSSIRTARPGRWCQWRSATPTTSR